MEDTLQRNIREAILTAFLVIKMRSEETTCKRKGVGAAILEIDTDEFSSFNSTPFKLFYAINGHSGDGTGNECQNIIGACGCAHAEPRVIMDYLKHFINLQEEFDLDYRKKYWKTILLTTYSACVNCANIIIDSGIIDVVAYEIHAEYWDEPPRNASKIIRAKLPMWTKEEIIDDIYGNKILDLLNS